MRLKMFTRLWLPLLFLLFGLFCLFFERSPFFAELQQALRTDRVHTGMLNYGEKGKVLRELGLVRLVDNDGTRFPRTQGNETWATSQPDLEIIPFQKKRKVDEYLYQAQPGSTPLTVSHFFPNGITHKGDWPILAIQLPPEALYDPERGIIANRAHKGREWERAAEVSFIVNGEMQFSSVAGLRIHGGIRRLVQPFQSYRLYFRKKYGMEAVPDGLLLQTGFPIRTLVVQIADWPSGQPMNNPLAYDISERIGCLVPQTRLVEVYLNGISQGMTYITEHLSRRQWDQRMGDSDEVNYMFYKWRGTIPHADEVDFTDRMWTYINDRETFSFERVSSSIDMDNITRHVFSWVFNGTTDYCQGVAFVDKNDPDARVSYINWDMDHSFWDWRAETFNIERPNWEQESFEIIYRDRHHCDRTKLFSRLINESPSYRTYALNLFTEILNHRLTDAFLHGRVRYYQEMMRTFGESNEEYAAMLNEFMDNRTRKVREEMSRQFDLHGPFACRVRNDGEYDLIVDGYPYKSDYEGFYFQGQNIRIAPAGGNNEPLHWMVNGERQVSPALDLVVDRDIHIEVVSAGK